MNIDIGKRIKEVFDQQPKSHTINWFAEQLHCNRSNIYDIFSRKSIDVNLLDRIPRVLEHDFFIELSQDLNRPEKI